MNITVSEQLKANLLGGPENMKTELKTSIFFAPKEKIPGLKQYYQIAKTIAGFINGEGGTLWLGVDDDGIVTGIESDLAVLAGGSAMPCRGPHSNDEGMTFGGTADKYILKLKELVKAYLGQSAERYIAGAQAAIASERIIVKVPVSKAEPGYVAYVYKWHPGDKCYSQEIYQRAANGTSHLEGFARDEFIRGKCREEFKRQLAALQDTAGGLTKEELMAALKEMQAQSVIEGAPVIVSGAVVIKADTLKAVSRPKGVVFDGEHLCDVKSWKDVFAAIYEKLNELNPTMFDGAVEAFPKWFKRGGRPRGCYKLGLGTAGDIRPVEVTNKVYLTTDGSFFRKVMESGGVSMERFSIRA